MGKYDIRIIKDKTRISQHGKVELYNTGDWLSVGRMEAMTLVAEGKAEMQDTKGLLDTKGTAVYVPESGIDELTLFFKIPVIGINPYPVDAINSQYNLFLGGGYCYKSKNSPEIIRNPSKFAFVFEYMKTHDVVLILRDYNKTVAELGRELSATEKHSYDNRVMSYQTCAVGIQNTKIGLEFYKAWQDEKANGEFNALVRALFIVKPTVYYLPPEWGLMS